jgi:hypothetical protein
MFFQPVNDFHSFHAFPHEEFDNVPLLHFHDKWRFCGMAPINLTGLDGHSLSWHRTILQLCPFHPAIRFGTIPQRKKIRARNTHPVFGIRRDCLILRYRLQGGMIRELKYKATILNNIHVIWVKMDEPLRRSVFFFWTQRVLAGSHFTSCGPHSIFDHLLALRDPQTESHLGQIKNDLQSLYKVASQGYALVQKFKWTSNILGTDLRPRRTLDYDLDDIIFRRPGNFSFSVYGVYYERSRNRGPLRAIICKNWFYFNVFTMGSSHVFLRAQENQGRNGPPHPIASFIGQTPSLRLFSETKWKLVIFKDRLWDDIASTRSRRPSEAKENYELTEADPDGLPALERFFDSGASKKQTCDSLYFLRTTLTTLYIEGPSLANERRTSIHLDRPGHYRSRMI